MFNGFPESLSSFFEDLRLNNDREWFEANRARYDRDVLEPSKAFVVTMGQALRVFAPDVHAEPKVNRSLFRIHRDVRFSPDKSPYKTNMGVWFWEGEGKRMECSGFYLHVEPPTLMLGVGIYQFPKPLLDAWRESVIHPKLGPALVEAIAQVEAIRPGAYKMGGQTYKRIPRDYDPDHDLADLLLFSGLYAGLEVPTPESFASPGFIDFCADHYRAMLPVHRWLKDMTARVRA
jgi:uncharacterized protein (TIGR02453 family)